MGFNQRKKRNMIVNVESGLQAETKCCKRCNVDKPLSSYYKREASKDSLQSICKQCDNARTSDRNRRNPESGRRRTAKREKSAKGKLYKFNWKLKQRGADFAVGSIPNKCEVCGMIGVICQDHNHSTMKFRGFLCRHCNLAIGYVKDDPKLLEALATYLRERDGK